LVAILFLPGGAFGGMMEPWRVEGRRPVIFEEQPGHVSCAPPLPERRRRDRPEGTSRTPPRGSGKEERID
jgi:hypothetical protein